MMKFLEFGIAHDEPVAGVPQDESFRDGLDRVAKAYVGRCGALGEGLLFGDVDGDADEVRGFARPLPHELGPRTHPDPLAVDSLHPESVIDRIGVRTGQHLGQRREGAILRMNQRTDVAKGHELAGRRHAEHLVHRIRPVDAPAREIPIPEAAASPAKRGVDSVLHPLAQLIGLACARRLPEIGGRQGNQHKDRADRKDGGAIRRRLPFGQDRHHGMDDSDLAERRIERAHGRQGIPAVREVDPQDAGFFREYRQWLGGPQIIGERGVGAGERGSGGDDIARGIGHGQLLPTRDGAGRRRPRQSRRRIGFERIPKRAVEVAGDDAGGQFDVGEGIRHRAIIRLARHDDRDRDKRAGKERHRGGEGAPYPNFALG